MRTFFSLVAVAFLLTLPFTAVQSQNLSVKIDQMAEQIDEKVISWRRDIHQHPELSNREFRTAKMVAEHLESLGIEVQTGIAHTGVVGVLKGGKPGPVVALRADMDALPVVERVDIPFASKEKGEYNGEEVGVMHACGHDTHVAILMGVAETLSSMRKDLKGTVKFLFQPAEEGAPAGEEGGADLMIKEGALKNPDVDVVFGLHINSQTPVNTIGYRPEGTMASVDGLEIIVKGTQTHGAYPWSGVDPIVTSAQIIMGLQTIVSRNLELLKAPAVVTIGKIEGGVRSNIIPEEVKMIGTIRSLDPEMQDKIHKRIHEIATNIGESAGAEVEVNISRGYPVTYNDPELTAQMLGTLEETAGKENVILRNAVTGAEDFSYFAQEVPGLFFFLGGMPADMNPEEAAPHHTPDFYIDDSGLKLGVRALCNLTLDYMESPEAMGK
ncbi:amidohydrolase [Catalinimonas niigatensis]|uniref:amidohydrolase n=1 Tax=Catalinimonas niigatensis TaxID=1397264 RepID=UPI002666C3B4|nr:amidohydrolase [Catalinimonas niigatensis]WPP48364.1 amidohydrolase [Catalinimonas niigatensis]